MKYTFTLFTAFFIFIVVRAIAQNGDNLEPLSYWIYSSEQEQFSVSFWRDRDRILLGYTFVYENGNKVNGITRDQFSELREIGEGCYVSSVFDLFRPNLLEGIDVILCQREDSLFWALLDEEGFYDHPFPSYADTSPYLPPYVVFHRSEF